MFAEAESSSSNIFLSAALSYAARGWPVFPCRPRAKEPLTQHGCKDATTDPHQITQWWTRWPEANIGIATGMASRIIVIDVDVDTEKGIDGEETLRTLEAQHGELP